MVNIIWLSFAPSFSLLLDLSIQTLKVMALKNDKCCLRKRMEDFGSSNILRPKFFHSDTRGPQPFGLYHTGIPNKSPFWPKLKF